MDRTQKETAVAELTEDLKDAEAVFAVDYRGISVTDAAELRGKLREADAVFKVVKNRLAKLAAADAGTELDQWLVGPTALTLIKGDPVLAAKAIADFSKLHEDVEYKGGLMDGAALDPEAFQVIARLPGLDVLHGQVVMMVASPLTGLARGLGAMVGGLAIALGQIAEQGLVTGEPPAAEEAPEAEAPDAGSDPEAPDATADAGSDPEEPEAPEPEAEGSDPSAEPEAEGSDPSAEPQASETEETEDEESSEEEPAAEADGAASAEETESEDE